MFIFPRPLVAVAAGLAVALGMVGLAGLGEGSAPPEMAAGPHGQVAAHPREARTRGACAETESTPPAYDTRACTRDARCGIVRAGS
ncbi:MAG TPA: hypothetical protein VEY89_08425 [Candidatus Dormibacteraeota bacterium]|nr:hypothetical protein [Candidatus Dormibacteraeota bacterium]